MACRRKRARTLARWRELGDSRGPATETNGEKMTSKTMKTLAPFGFAIVGILLAAGSIELAHADGDAQAGERAGFCLLRRHEEGGQDLGRGDARYLSHQSPRPGPGHEDDLHRPEERS